MSEVTIKVIVPGKCMIPGCPNDALLLCATHEAKQKAVASKQLIDAWVASGWDMVKATGDAARRVKPGG